MSPQYIPIRKWRSSIAAIIAAAITSAALPNAPGQELVIENNALFYKHGTESRPIEPGKFQALNTGPDSALHISLSATADLRLTLELLSQGVNAFSFCGLNVTLYDRGTFKATLAEGEPKLSVMWEHADVQKDPASVGGWNGRSVVAFFSGQPRSVFSKPLLDLSDYAIEQPQPAPLPSAPPVVEVKFERLKSVTAKNAGTPAPEMRHSPEIKAEPIAILPPEQTQESRSLVSTAIPMHPIVRLKAATPVAAESHAPKAKTLAPDAPVFAVASAPIVVHPEVPKEVRNPRVLQLFQAAILLAGTAANAPIAFSNAISPGEELLVPEPAPSPISKNILGYTPVSGDVQAQDYSSGGSPAANPLHDSISEELPLPQYEDLPPAIPVPPSREPRILRADSYPKAKVRSTPQIINYQPMYSNSTSEQ